MESLWNPQNANLLVSACVLLFGLSIYWSHPKAFHEHASFERAFEFWVFKWILYVVTWGLLTGTSDLRFVLAANDLNSVVGLGFVAAMWFGDGYEERHTVVTLLFLFGILVAWNSTAYSLAGPSHVWIFPSMVTSVIFISAMGGVIVARYRAPAIAFAVIGRSYW